jgi:hypothetical protein
VQVRSGPATVTRVLLTISTDPGSQDVCRSRPLSHSAYAGLTHTCRGRGYPQEGCEVRTFPFSAIVGSTTWHSP